VDYSPRKQPEMLEFDGTSVQQFVRAKLDGTSVQQFVTQEQTKQQTGYEKYFESDIGQCFWCNKLYTLTNVNPWG
jgi:hypothetical protein